MFEKDSCSSNPPSVTVTNDSPSPTRIVSVDLEFKATELARLSNLKTPQSIEETFKPVITNKMLPAGGSFTIKVKHALSENESFSASVNAVSPSTIGSARSKATSITAGCANINASTLPKAGSYGGNFGGLFPAMPATGGGGMVRYARAALAADTATR